MTLPSVEKEYRKQVQCINQAGALFIFFFLYYQVYKTRGEIESFKPNNTRLRVACENIRFSWLFTAGDAKSEEKRMFSHARLRVFFNGLKISDIDQLILALIFRIILV